MTLDQRIQQLLGRQSRDLASICGRFHSHLTIAVESPENLAALAEFCRPRPMKLTVIELSDGAEQHRQRDVMTTQYHLDQHTGAVSRIASLLLDLSDQAAAAGFAVLRIKLEHEEGPGLTQLSEDRYRETHIKLRIPAADFHKARRRLAVLGETLGFRPSRNPYQQDAEAITQFVNLRSYSGTCAAADAGATKVVSALVAEGFTVTEVKRETAVFDNRREHDAWWI